MSTIISANVSDGTLSIPTTFVTNGSAKAWVNFDGTGTIAARDSLNLSSLGDFGTGVYGIFFANAFLAADYSNLAQSDGMGGSAMRITTCSQQLASEFILRVTNTSGTAQDNSFLCASVNGDLA
jgi:hypothetical protein